MAMNVKQFQEALIKLGYGEYLRPYGADGKRGTKTKNATKKMQKDYNRIYNKSIAVDGINGKDTDPAAEQMLKDAGTKGTRNFKIREFACKADGSMLKGGMDSKLLHKLEELRYHFNDKAVVINSGYRTPAHNKAVGGASGSQHLYGRAADIVVRGVKPSTVYAYADNHFDGVGKYNTFTHVDVRGYKARF